MGNAYNSDELQHHGIMGMKWGVRRYQNKDGTLKPAGIKRYNKEVEKLKKETAKVKAAEQVEANRKKTQAKLDRLESKKQALEERKKALKEEKYGKKKKGEADENKGETPEQRKERLMKSSDPKELYKYKDDLSYVELNDRINRIDLENKLQSRIVEEHKTTGMEYMDKVKNVIDKSSALYKSVDTAYSTFANSSIAKAMGLDLPTGQEKPKFFNSDEFLKKARANKLTVKEIQDGMNALKNLNTAEQQKKQLDKGRAAEVEAAKQKAIKEEKAAKAKEAQQKAKEALQKAKEKSEAEAAQKAQEAEERHKSAQKSVDDYNERYTKDGADDRVTSTHVGPDGTYSYKKTDINNARDTVNKLLIEDKTPYSNVSSYETYSYGRNHISGLLEGPVGKAPIDVTPEERK